MAKCIICLDSDPPPIQCGCACRSDGGLAHVECLIEKAEAQRPHRGKRVRWECLACELLGIHGGDENLNGTWRSLEGWWLRVWHQAEASKERLAAARNLAEWAPPARLKWPCAGQCRFRLGSSLAVAATVYVGSGILGSTGIY